MMLDALRDIIPDRDWPKCFIRFQPSHRSVESYVELGIRKLTNHGIGWALLCCRYFGRETR
jgi:hypothetical protein